MKNDFAPSVMLSLTRSMKDIWDGDAGSGRLFGAASPSNLHVSVERCQKGARSILIWHDYQETFCRILVRLKLVVG
jgi:hypothetical protein